MADVLIVDDQPDIRYAIARVLESAGHRVTEAAAATEARALLAARYDLIICDIQLPHGQGLGLIRDAASTQPAAKLVALVGDGLASSAPSVATARALAVDEVLRTPFDFDTLLGTVARLVGQRAAAAPRTARPSQA
jgi:DNA-binding NtrC family response regulator